MSQNLPISLFAWLNLWRRKRRTLITAFSIGFGVLLAVTFTGTGDYAYTNMINAGAAMGMGHVTVQPQGYSKTPTLDRWLTGAGEAREQILSLPGVEGALVRITGQAMFASAHKSIGGMFLAFDPNVENGEQNLFLRSISEGKAPEPGDRRGALIGERLAKKLGLKLGRKLVYTTTDKNGEIVSEIARVRGLFHTGVDEIDGAMALLTLDGVRTTLGYGPSDATLVAVLLDDQRHAEETQRAIQKLVGTPEREVLSWKESQPDLAGIIAMDRGGNYISQLLVGLLIAAGIFNTLLMSVLERTREFGIMLAIGMAPRTLFRLVVAESFWLALLGLLLGLLITAPWYYYLHQIGIDFSDALGGDYSAGGVLVDPIFRIRLYLESAVAILVGVFGLTLAAGIYPAWKAARVPPVESLKNI